VDDFKDIAMLWFDSYKLGVKPRTVQIMQTRLNNYVLPALGEYRIDKVNSIILQQIVNQWMINASQPLNGAYHRPKGKGKDFKIYFNIVE
ncbi:N-terminal phage integrase SAM-like domain-containing protein, partial [Salmonella enterica]